MFNKTPVFLTNPLFASIVYTCRMFSNFVYIQKTAGHVFKIDSGIIVITPGFL